MRVAILGSRGMPALYGGFDTLVEELSLGLASAGLWEVLVYCRSSYFSDRPSKRHGVQLVYLPTPRIKALESLFHSFLSSLHVLGQNIDIIYFVDPANAPFCLLLRLFGKRVIIHTDGLGWKRRKWGWFARHYYRFTEWLSSRTANGLITDNPVMHEYYKKEYNANSTYIPYGAASRSGIDESVYQKLELAPHNYLLVVARFEPENNIDFIILEYVRSKVKIPLVIVGSSPYDQSYTSYLHKLADERVHFIGRIDEQPKLNALYAGAYLYIHGHEVGGTNPSLLRAMGMGATPVVINVPFNTAVIDKCGFVFERVEGNLCKILECLEADQNEVRQAAKKAQERVQLHFSWELVIKQHEQLFHMIVEQESI